MQSQCLQSDTLLYKQPTHRPKNVKKNIGNLLLESRLSGQGVGLWLADFP